MQICKYIYTYAYIYVHVCMCVHTYIRTHTYINMYAHLNSSLRCVRNLRQRLLSSLWNAGCQNFSKVSILLTHTYQITLKHISENFLLQVLPSLGNAGWYNFPPSQLYSAWIHAIVYGVASISRLLKIKGLFCKRALKKRRYSAKETCRFKELNNRSQPTASRLYRIVLSSLEKPCRHNFSKISTLLNFTYQMPPEHTSENFWQRLLSSLGIAGYHNFSRASSTVLGYMQLSSELTFAKFSCNCCRRLGKRAKGWLRLVGSLKLQVSFAKEPYERDDILQKRRIMLRSLLIVATPQHSSSPSSKVSLPSVVSSCRVIFLLETESCSLIRSIYN